MDDYVSKDTRKLKLRDLTDEESKIYNDRLESEAVDTAIAILDNLRPSCGSKLTFTEEEVCTALSVGISAIKKLKEAKRLLRLAVDDFANVDFHIFECDGMCDTCPIHGNRDTCDEWRYADEALKLIGDDPNGI